MIAVSIQDLSNSSFTDHPITQRSIFTVTGSVVKQTGNQWDIDVGMFLSKEGQLCGAVPCISRCSRRHLPIETRVRSKARSHGICGGQSGTGTGVAPSAAVFLCLYHSTSSPPLVYHQQCVILATGSVVT
jgi:hypothetical protein